MKEEAELGVGKGKRKVKDVVVCNEAEETALARMSKGMVGGNCLIGTFELVRGILRHIIFNSSEKGNECIIRITGDRSV